MSIRLDWLTPTTRTSGRPLQAGDLVGYALNMQVDGAPSGTALTPPAATDITYTVDVTDPGTYDFELHAIDKAGKAGASWTGKITIDDTSPISAPVVTLSLV